MRGRGSPGSCWRAFPAVTPLSSIRAQPLTMQLFEDGLCCMRTVLLGNPAVSHTVLLDPPFFAWSSGFPFFLFLHSLPVDIPLAPYFSLMFVLCREIHCTQMSAAMPITLFSDGNSLFLQCLPKEMALELGLSC